MAKNKETKEQKLKALLLDASYEDIEGKSVIKLFVNDGKKRYWLFDKNFNPYLFVSCEKGKEEAKIDFLSKFVFGHEEKFSAIKVEKTKFKVAGEPALKVSFNKVSQLVQAREYFSQLGFKKYEYDIPYGKRYLIDKELEPANWIEAIVENENEICELNKAEGDFDTEMKSFDLETWMGKKFEVGAEPIVFASVVSNKKKKSRVLSYNTAEIKGLELVESEKEVIEELTKELNECDCIVTYNGDNFDFAYTKIRAKKFKTDFLINGQEPRIIRNGLDNAVKLSGIQHIDAFQIMQFLQRTGSVNTVKLDIESVSEKVFGVKKEKVYPAEINEAWQSKDEEKVERVVDYNLKDSETALRIAEEFLPLFIEVSKLTSQTLFDTTRSATSSMVEDLLLKEAHEREVIAPNKPKEDAVTQRTMNPIKGAFVKEPLAGLHEGIAVLDFASLYPSIIISHNISPEKLNCSHEECKKKNTTPDGTWFCTKEKGLFPEILGKMLKKRLVLKKEYKEKKKKGIDDKTLFAKQWALKIILNSVYGYLGYPRARWYSRECASATTALARGYIQSTIKKAQEAGFEVLYGDTDSNFLKMLDKSKKDIENFVDKINKELPEGMELEIDGYYKRGIFVTKKEGGAAKKRYALIDEKGNLKIVGFEYVRRDWCNIAKETQRKIIELVLSEGKTQEAVQYARKIIKELKEGKVKKSELIMMTMLQRKPSQYTAIGPHVAAAMKAIERGKELGPGSMLSFIVTRGKEKASISERAELEEYVEEGNYDADYYIENQVIPAVIKIMQELGYTKEDLISGGKQTGLGSWS